MKYLLSALSTLFVIEIVSLVLNNSKKKIKEYTKDVYNFKICALSSVTMVMWVGVAFCSFCGYFAHISTEEYNEGVAPYFFGVAILCAIVSIISLIPAFGISFL